MSKVVPVLGDRTNHPSIPDDDSTGAETTKTRPFLKSPSGAPSKKSGPSSMRRLSMSSSFSETKPKKAKKNLQVAFNLNKIQYYDHDEKSKRSGQETSFAFLFDKHIMLKIEGAVHKVKMVTVLNEYLVVALHIFTCWMLPFSCIFLGGILPLYGIVVEVLYLIDLVSRTFFVLVRGRIRRKQEEDIRLKAELGKLAESALLLAGIGSSAGTGGASAITTTDPSAAGILLASSGGKGKKKKAEIIHLEVVGNYLRWKGSFNFEIGPSLINDSLALVSVSFISCVLLCDRLVERYKY